ncbi:MAG TPA: hypothetical protein VGI45_27945 [Terracidiphilus sp.]|jgi:hypothetical protein
MKEARTGADTLDQSLVMDQGLVFNAKAIASFVEQVDDLLGIDVDQIQAFVDGKPERRSAFTGVRHGGMPEAFAFIRIRAIAEEFQKERVRFATARAGRFRRRHIVSFRENEVCGLGYVSVRALTGSVNSELLQVGK